MSHQHAVLSDTFTLFMVSCLIYFYFSVSLGHLLADVMTPVPLSIFNMWHHPSILSSLRKLEGIHLEYGSARWELELISWQCYCWYMLCPESYRGNQICLFGSFSARLLSLHQMENLVCRPDCSSTCSSRSTTFGVSGQWGIHQKQHALSHFIAIEISFMLNGRRP